MESDYNRTLNIISDHLPSYDTFMDPPQDDYFRLYEAVDIDDEEGETSNFVVAIWNPQGGGANQTATTNLTSTKSAPFDNGGVDTVMSTWSSIVSTVNNSLRLPYSNTVSGGIGSSSIGRTVVSSTSPSPLTDDMYFDSQSADDSESRLYSAFAQMPAVESTLGDINNYGDDNDIALIDSAETSLRAIVGSENIDDYDAVGFNDGGRLDGVAVDNDLIHQSISYDSVSERNDSSFHQSFDGGGDVGGAGGGVGGSGDGGVASGGDDGDKANGGSTFMLLLEDFGEYFYNYNGSMVSGTTTTTITNITDFNTYRINCTNLTLAGSSSSSTSCYDISEVDHNYWALILILFPILTLFGNILVILSVCRERSLQTVTNYFIVSLAIADLLVAVVVMPFAVYALVSLLTLKLYLILKHLNEFF